jgi:putative FmdB family regulatory protein
MPIYEYRCNKCGVFEVTGRITEKPLRKCPTCKGKVERIISNTSFVLKGTGWYVTDYAKRAPSAPSESSDTVNSSSESKPAAPAAAATNGKPAASEKSASSPASPPAPAAPSTTGATKSAE